MDKERCGWAKGTFEQYEKYHDEEWGVPNHDDKKHFEFLILESAQSGLSWSTILKKRDGYRTLFADFD
ncbi:MAG: DNA-3-methyladenine glycosylase I, partial [Flavobacteriaceae bacterium]